MKSPADYTIFNSVDPDALTPKAAKPLPFPLENMDQEISEAFAKLDRIAQKLHAAKVNPVNNTPAKKRRIKALEYKCKACLQFLKDISQDVTDLWF